MKKISIISVLILIVFLIHIGTSLSNGWVSMGKEPSLLKESFTKDFPFEAKKIVTLEVRPIQGKLDRDSVFNTKLSGEVPYQKKQIEVCTSIPMWTEFLFFPAVLLLLPLLIWAVVSLIRLLISVYRQEVFTKKNVERLRIFVYVILAGEIVVKLSNWICYYYAASQIQLPGYQITTHANFLLWTFLLLLVLLVEIFAKGVKIKEEQDLTI